jgi:hypothetical protein
MCSVKSGIGACWSACCASVSWLPAPMSICSWRATGCGVSADIFIHRRIPYSGI